MDIRDFQKFIGEKKLFTKSDHILLAVSGGIDSVVMTDLFHKAGYRFGIAHCNFGLRGKDSEMDAAFTTNLAHRLHCPFFLERFDTERIARQKGISIQMAARELRYAWFEKLRIDQGYDHIATAHHLDDQAETFLINLVRGTGISGLHGIPVKNEAIIRPLMFTFREDIERYAVENKLTFRTDHSNDEKKYLRNRIRHEVIPLLRSINPDFIHGLTDTIGRISEFEQVGDRALSEWRLSVIKPDGDDQTVDIVQLAKQMPVGLFAWAMLSPFGFNETQVANLLDSLQQDERKVFQSPTHRLVKERGRLIISVVVSSKYTKPIKINTFVRKKSITVPLRLCFERIGDVKHYEIPASGHVASLDFDKIRFPMMIRRWQQGDAFIPLGLKKKKKLSDFFIDHKFSTKEKENVWLLCSGKDILWIIGYRIDHRYRVTAATKEVLKIVMHDA